MLKNWRQLLGIDDTVVDGKTRRAASSNWAYDHNAAITAVHGVGAGNVVADPLLNDIDLAGYVGTNTFEFYRALFRESYVVEINQWPTSVEVVSGSGATGVDATGISAHTAATHESTAGRYLYMEVANTTSWRSFNFDKKSFLAFGLRWGGADTTNLTLAVQLSNKTTIGALAAYGYGIITNAANINLETYGTGAAQVKVSAATNLVSQNRVWILIEHDPAVADRLYINGVLAATQSTAASIPSTELVNATIVVSITRTGGADTGDEYMEMNHIILGREL